MSINGQNENIQLTKNTISNKILVDMANLNKIIENKTIKTYDLMIIDDVESCMNYFTKHKNKQIFNIFNTLLNTAKKIITINNKLII